MNDPVQAAELAGAETRYRLQLAREMYEAGRRDAEAEMAERWRNAAAPVVRGMSQAGLEERCGDRAAVPTSQTRAPAKRRSDHDHAHRRVRL
jgi:hypothetical protein